MNYKFSIIMPCYNSEKYIYRSINSILNQTYTNWELIIVNDGSTDNTIKIINKHFKDKRIVFIDQENQGSFLARQTGLKNVSGDYFFFLDSDDEYISTALEIANLYIKKQKVDIYCFGLKKKQNDIERIVFQRLDNLTILKNKHDVLYFNYINETIFEGLIPKCYSSSLIKKNYFIDEFRASKGEDFLQGLYFTINSNSLMTINEVLYIYNEECDSITHKWNYQDELDYIFKIKHKVFDILNNANIFSKSEMKFFLKQCLSDLAYSFKIISKDHSIDKKSKKKILKNIKKEVFFKRLNKTSLFGLSKGNFLLIFLYKYNMYHLVLFFGFFINF